MIEDLHDKTDFDAHIQSEDFYLISVFSDDIYSFCSTSYVYLVVEFDKGHCFLGCGFYVSVKMSMLWLLILFPFFFFFHIASLNIEY